MNTRIYLSLVCLTILIFFLVSCNNDSGTSPSNNDDLVYISTASIEQKDNQVLVKALVTDLKGNPLSLKRVDFEIIEGDGELNVHSNLTDSTGYAEAIVNNPKQGTIKIKTTVFGYDSTVNFIINYSPNITTNEKASIIVSSISFSTVYRTGKKQCDLSFMITDEKGNPLPNKRIDFEIIEGDGTLNRFSDFTGDQVGYIGVIYGITVTQNTSSIVKIKATIFGYDASVVQTIQF